MSKTQETIQFAGHELILDAEGALFFPKKKALILSDVHLTKTGHFRQQGIAIPQNSSIYDLNRLEQLLKNYKAESCFFLGDLFHSDPNPEWNDVVEWFGNHSEYSFHLVEGNHDTASLHYLDLLNITNEGAESQLGNIRLVHEFTPNNDSSLPRIGGHLHPKVRLKGKGRQGLSFPAFLIRQHSLLLPAFGSFTGGKVIPVFPSDQIFILSSNQLYHVH